MYSIFFGSRKNKIAVAELQTVTRNPSNICHTSKNIVGIVIRKDVLVTESCIQQISSRAMSYSFGRSGTP